MARVSTIFPHKLRFMEALRDLRHARPEFGVTETRIQELSVAVEHAFRDAMEAMKKERDRQEGFKRVPRFGAEGRCVMGERKTCSACGKPLAVDDDVDYDLVRDDDDAWEAWKREHANLCWGDVGDTTDCTAPHDALGEPDWDAIVPPLRAALAAAETDRQRIDSMRRAVVRFAVAYGPHLSDSWRDFFAEEFGLEVDPGSPYRHLRIPASTLAERDARAHAAARAMGNEYHSMPPRPGLPCHGCGCTTLCPGTSAEDRRACAWCGCPWCGPKTEPPK